MKSLNNVKAGFYKTRLVKNGPYVPAVIYQSCPVMPCNDDVATSEWFSPLERSRPLQALVDGQADDVEKLWVFGEPIEQLEYDFMMKNAEWCRKYAPKDPIAQPYRSMNYNQIPILF